MNRMYVSERSEQRILYYFSSNCTPLRNTFCNENDPGSLRSFFKFLFFKFCSLLLSFAWNLSNILATEMQLKLCFQGCSSLKCVIFHSTGWAHKFGMIWSTYTNFKKTLGRFQVIFRPHLDLFLDHFCNIVRPLLATTLSRICWVTLYQEFFGWSRDLRSQKFALQ